MADSEEDISDTGSWATASALTKESKGNWWHTIQYSYYQTGKHSFVWTVRTT